MPQEWETTVFIIWKKIRKITYTDDPRTESSSAYAAVTEDEVIAKERLPKVMRHLSLQLSFIIDYSMVLCYEYSFEVGWRERSAWLCQYHILWEFNRSTKRKQPSTGRSINIRIIKRGIKTIFCWVPSHIWVNLAMDRQEC